jgi:hypothetical protein
LFFFQRNDFKVALGVFECLGDFDEFFFGLNLICGEIVFFLGEFLQFTLEISGF